VARVKTMTIPVCITRTHISLIPKISLALSATQRRTCTS